MLLDGADIWCLSESDLHPGTCVLPSNLLFTCGTGWQNCVLCTEKKCSHIVKIVACFQTTPPLESSKTNTHAMLVNNSILHAVEGDQTSFNGFIYLIFLKLSNKITSKLLFAKIGN